MALGTQGFVTAFTRDPVCGSEDELISSIVDKIVKEDIGAVVIVEKGVPVGIVTERDIIEKVVKTGKDPKKMFVKDVMTKPVVTISSNKSIQDALKMMVDNKRRRLPVVDRKTKRVVGILTERRIFDSLLQR
ncbi:MAG: hypothetical protein QG670_2039 [Thermoproteota archaeon]|nr:hypothetical protein [Thermoproteota archaeon]